MSTDPKPSVDLIPKDQLDSLTAKYGPVCAVKTRAGVFGFRVAKRGEYDRYTAMIYQDKARPKATEYLTRACVVWPGNEPSAALALFDAAIDRLPGIIMTCGNHLIEHCGFDSEAEVGKAD